MRLSCCAKRASSAKSLSYRENEASTKDDRAVCEQRKMLSAVYGSVFKGRWLAVVVEVAERCDPRHVGRKEDKAQTLETVSLPKHEQAYHRCLKLHGTAFMNLERPDKIQYKFALAFKPTPQCHRLAGFSLM